MRLKELIKKSPVVNRTPAGIAVRQPLLRHVYQITCRGAEYQSFVSVKAVKAVTGKGALEYANSVRLEEGKRLLDATDDVIDAIAEKSGFNSTRTFYWLFRIPFHSSTPLAFCHAPA